MAIYSLRLAPIGKTTQKRPFTAAAHIRYITRKGAVTHVMSERMPEGRVAAMRWLRSQEKADRVNARVADKLVIALPRELTAQQRVELLWGFAEDLSQGRASWFAAIHAKGKDRDNPHAHLLVRDRDVRNGERVVMFSAGQKEAAQRAAKGLKVPTTLRQIREMWAKHANRALERAGRSERIDHRRLVDQGQYRLAQVHEGPNVRAMHARGVRPESRERVMRNPAMHKKGAPKTRVVKFEDIDLGRTRVEYNLSLKDAPPLSLSEDPCHPVALAQPSRIHRVDADPWADTLSSCRVGRCLLRFGMVEESIPTVASLQADIDAVRANYADVRQQLEAALGRLYDDPSSVADELLSQADEFGQEHVTALFAQHPHDYGKVRQHGDLPWSETAERAGEELAKLVDAHNRLDHLTLQREALLKRDDPSRPPVVNIQGWEFTLDEARRELRPTDRPDERHALDLEPVPQRELTLTEQIARERNVEPAQPQPEHDRYRTRTR